jgi:CBS domain-containing protein
MRIPELQTPIRDVVPHIFKRPLLSVGSSDSLLQVGTFLAVGPQIYVDGLVVIDNSELTGIIGGGHIAHHILEHEHDWPRSTAANIMNREPPMVEPTDSLDVALNIFLKTRFAFVPVVSGGKVITSLSIRDVIRAVGRKLSMQASPLASKLISVDPTVTLKEALGLMLERGIRNLAVTKAQEPVRLATDRKILEFLLSYDGRRAVTGSGLGSFSLNQLDLLFPKYLNDDTARAAAEYLSDIGTPCLLLGDSRILTPWDIVIKGILA